MNKAVYERICYLKLLILLDCVRNLQVHIGDTASWTHCFPNAF